MSPDPPTTPAVTARPVAGRLARSRFRRRLLKFGAWLMLMALLTALLLAVAVKVLYDQRLKVVNQLLQLNDTPFEIQVGEIDGTRDGAFTAKDLMIRLPDADAGDELLHIPEATWQVRWRDSIDGKFDELVLRNPTLSIDSTNWHALSEWLAQPKQTPASPPPKSSKGFNLAPWADRLRIEDAKIDLRLPGLPRISARMDYDGEAIGLIAGHEQLIRTGRQKLTLRDVRIHPPSVSDDGWLSAPLLVLPQVDLVYHIKDRVLGVLELDLIEPALEVEPDAARWLAGLLVDSWNKPAPAAQTSPILVPTALTGSSAPVWIESIELQKLAIRDARLMLHESLLILTEAQNTGPLVLPGITTGLGLDMRDARWAPGTGFEPGTIELSMEQFELAAADLAPQKLRFDQATLGLQVTKDGLRLLPARLLHPEIHVERELIDVFASWLAPRPEDDGSAPDTKSKPLSLDGLEVVGGRIRVIGADPAVPNVSATIEGQLTDWTRTTTGALQSDELQRLYVRDLELWFSQSEPFFTADRVELEAVPDVLMRERRIERLSMRESAWNLSPERIPRLAAEDRDPAPVVADDSRPLWHGWWAEHLELLNSSLELRSLAGGLPDMRANFSITTARAEDHDDPLYYLVLENAEARLPTVSQQPLVRLKHAAMRLNPQQLWQNGNLGALDLVGASLYAGQGLRDHFATDSDPAEAAPETAEGTAETPNPWIPDWHLEKLILRESMLTISDIAPGLPDLAIALDLSTQNIPLSAERMTEGSELIKLELSTALRSPQDVRYVVADLRSVFVEFTLAGLLRQEIERVQLIAPTLNIGQHLFAYIDQYREMTRATTGAGAPTLPLPDGDDESMAPDGWNIRRIEVESGQLVVAPKGVALFPNPFPFSAVTELADGRLDATFIVPKDDYDFDQLDLHLEGLSGEVIFNLPVAGEDNNLVEVLRADRIRWKDFEATDAFLSISYDRFGIYIGLGGNAYEGYVNGEFNIYLEHLYNWDGWLACTGINMKDVTEIISPEYFLMDGTVDLKLIAQGNFEELFEAFGELASTTPGTIHITQLDGVIDHLPEDWSPIKRQITTLGVEPLRWFEYDKGIGSFDLRRLGGTLSLALEGPHGERAFDVELHGQPLSMFIEPVLTEGYPVISEPPTVKIE